MLPWSQAYLRLGLGLQASIAPIEQACSPEKRYPDSRLVSALLQRNIPEVSPLRGLLLIPCMSAPSLGEGQGWILEPGSCPVLAARGLCLLTSSPHLAPSASSLGEEEALPAWIKSLLPVTRPLSPVSLQAGGTDILSPSWLFSAAALDPPLAFRQLLSSPPEQRMAFERHQSFSSFRLSCKHVGRNSSLQAGGSGCWLQNQAKAAAREGLAAWEPKAIAKAALNSSLWVHAAERGQTAGGKRQGRGGC